ncbi:response regulator [Dinghuibacter silviterrae]|uniref:CheY-like chemotaxis protein n=1 Tax=Dinghuibacter silviterrae TaxID=1539049 RepID=A0A4R8DFR5_9BACT|nr:response regulator [Dinghuibacter silviterrae]TDW95936.1 CheY-like chemotaxis protein [Dinghuibacter silviterrae]
MDYKFKKVLVVDDNEIDLYIAEVVMKNYGFAEDVVCVSSAREALEYLRPLQDNPEELPHYIFLDINMPEMSGFDFLDEYQHLPENIRKRCIVMMLTTSMDREDRIRAESNQFVQKFLNKPLDKEKLSQCV